MSQPGSLCVGIDVSKAILDIAASSAIEQFSVGNDSDGFDAIIAELRMYAIALVLMKATGGLETAIVCALQAEGFELAVVNPRQARDFARAMGYLAKTDSIDARVLSQMAEVLNRHPERERFIRALKWFTEFGHLNRGDMLTSEQHRCHNEKKKFQRRV